MSPLWAAALIFVQEGYPDYSQQSDAQVLALDCEQVTADADRWFAQCVDHQLNTRQQGL